MIVPLIKYLKKKMFTFQTSVQMSPVLWILPCPPLSPLNCPCLCSVTMQNQPPLISQFGKSLLSSLFPFLKRCMDEHNGWQTIDLPPFLSWIHKCFFLILLRMAGFIPTYLYNGIIIEKCRPVIYDRLFLCCLFSLCKAYTNRLLLLLPSMTISKPCDIWGTEI